MQKVFRTSWTTIIQTVYSKLFCGSAQIFSYENLVHIADYNPGFNLFKIKLSNYQAQVSRLTRYLDEHELKRSLRYHLPQDAHRFIICRSLLKILLSVETELSINEIFIQIDQDKKPYLSADPSIFFNVSHSGDYALIAIGKKQLGIDVEKIQREHDFSEIFPSVFNSIEEAIIYRAEDIDKQFLRFWTRKEAIVKASGKGINDDFVKIPVTDGIHVIESRIIGNISELAVLSFDVDEQHLGAIAFAGTLIDAMPKLHFSNIQDLTGFLAGF